jgi:hypothetical protein
MRTIKSELAGRARVVPEAPDLPQKTENSRNPIYRVYRHKRHSAAIRPLGHSAVTRTGPGLLPVRPGEICGRLFGPATITAGLVRDLF